MAMRHKCTLCPSWILRDHKYFKNFVFCGVVSVGCHISYRTGLHSLDILRLNDCSWDLVV